MSEVKVNKLSPRSGTTVTLGDSGDTITIPSGVTFDASSGGLAGTLTTAAQPNITSVGTLTSFASTGIDDNATSTAITIDSSQNVQINVGNVADSTPLIIKGGETDLSPLPQTVGMLFGYSGASGYNKTGLINEFETSAGLSALHIVNNSTTNSSDATKSDKRITIDYNGDISFYEDTGTTAKLFWDASTERLGIGTSSPDSPLDILTSGNSGLEVNAGTSSAHRIYLGNTGGTSVVGTLSNHNFAVITNTSERIRIDSSGNVGIGTTSPSSTLHISGDPQVQLTQPNNLVLQNDTDSATSGDAKTGILFRANYNGTTPTDLANITAGKENATNNNYGSFIGLCTRTNGVNTLEERMRINSAGKVGIGDTTLASNAILSVEGNIGSPLVKWYDKRSTSTVDVFSMYSDHAGTETRHFLIEADGDAFNTFGSYGSLSDRKFKENETDANSQWNDIKALQIKNYNLKISPDKQLLGVIAQDLEASGMNGLVKNKPEELYTENDVLPEGKNIGDIKEESYKEVKYSILYMKAVKALQEAMERIETLETQRAELEARITTLENA